jgi:hypothetical protein
MLSFDSFRAARWVRTINLVLQAVLFLTLFAGLNYLARNHAWRFDLTRQRTFSLTPETLSYLKTLERPVRIVVSSSTEGDNPEVKGLLTEFAHHTEDNPNGQITVEYIDVYQNRRHAEELGLGEADVILFISGDKRRAQKIDELYVIQKQERAKFQGEKVVTAAVLEVANQTRKKIYFVYGHGELEPDSDPARGLSTARDQLRVRNFDVDRIDLSVARNIPPDAALLIIAQPSAQSSFTGREQEMLRQYLSTRAGRIMLFLPPGKNVDGYGLADLLFDWGILVDDDYVIDPDPSRMTEDGDMMISAYDPTHPVMEAGRSAPLPLRFGAVRTVRPDPGKSAASGLTVIPLAAASPTAWGETAYRDMMRVLPTFDPATDIRPIPGIAPSGQLGVVVASERVAVRDNLPFSVPGGRMVVFGTGDLISNRRIVANGNLTVFLSAVNWCVDRDRLLNIPPRPLERFSLALSAAEFSRLRYTLLLVLPGATLFLGLLVYWTRRV